MITLEELKHNLWDSAEILRGHFDANECKGYLLRLLLFKRLSDVFEENYERFDGKKIDSYKARYLLKNKCFFFPENSRWDYLKSLDREMPYALNKAFQEIEYSNPTLIDIFTSVSFIKQKNDNNYKYYDMLIYNLFQNFSRLNLRNSNLAEPDIIAKSCEFLIRMFPSYADTPEFYAPRELAELLVTLLEVKEQMTICDPVCRVGNLLFTYVNYLKKIRLDPQKVFLYGQEKNFDNWIIARINLLLHDVFEFDIRLGDILRDPKLVKEGNLMLFDRVIANPPFNLKNWGHEEAEFDKFYRFRYGIPPKGSADFAYIQHILATLSENGKAAVILPLGVLFRGGKEGSIRKRIVEEDLIEAIIELAPNLFYLTKIPTAVIIFNPNKLKNRKNKILFIDASNEYQKSGHQNYLHSDNIDHIVTNYQAFTDKEGYAKVVSLEEIAANNYILNINRYVLSPKIKKNEISIEAEISKLRELEISRTEAEKDMNRYLRELGIQI